MATLILRKMKLVFRLYFCFNKSFHRHLKGKKTNSSCISFIYLFIFVSVILSCVSRENLYLFTEKIISYFKIRKKLVLKEEILLKINKVYWIVRSEIIIFDIYIYSLLFLKKSIDEIVDSKPVFLISCDFIRSALCFLY